MSFSGLDEFAKLWRAFLAYSKPRIFAHRETWGAFWGIGNLVFLRIPKLGESSLRSLKLPSHSETHCLAFVNIFRFRLGGLTKRECRADGGSSDGGVKGKPLNKPLKH